MPINRPIIQGEMYKNRLVLSNEFWPNSSDPVVVSEYEAKGKPEWSDCIDTPNTLVCEGMMR